MLRFTYPDVIELLSAQTSPSRWWYAETINERTELKTVAGEEQNKKTVHTKQVWCAAGIVGRRLLCCQRLARAGRDKWRSKGGVRQAEQ
jgi:hypothetical protein